METEGYSPRRLSIGGMPSASLQAMFPRAAGRSHLPTGDQQPAAEPYWHS